MHKSQRNGGGKKILKKQQSHYHLTPGLMSVAFKVPIWFFLQTGGICEKTKKKKNVTIITIMVNMEEYYECYVQEVESWVLNAVPEKREVFSRWVHCPGTSTLSLTKTHAGPTHTQKSMWVNKQHILKQTDNTVGNAGYNNWGKLVHSNKTVNCSKMVPTSSKEDSKFIPNATPIRPNKESEKVPMVSWRFSRIMTLRWLKTI